MALTFEKLDTRHISNTRKVFTAAVTDILTCTAHGLNTDDTIKLYQSMGVVGSPFPVPLVANRAYYVKKIDANTFYLALTAGGATIDITTTGSAVGVQFSLYRSRDYKMFTAGTDDIITCTGHGFVDGEIIKVQSNSALPAPLVSTTNYYVKYINANTFNLSLTSGGATIDITSTGTGSHWCQRRLGFYLISRGSRIDNTSRAGVGICTEISRINWGMGDLIAIHYQVVSGSFLTADRCTTPEGGMFNVYAPASDTRDVVVVNGVDDTDTTATLDGDIDNATQSVILTDVSGIPAIRYVRIDDEWMYVIYSSGTTDLYVKRGMFGTTPASHTSGASVYILEQDLPAKIVDKCIAESWGTCSKDTGKFILSGFVIMLGRPDQASKSIFLTVMDRFDMNDVMIAGDIIYGTIFQSGAGWVDAGVGVYSGLYFNGANLEFANFTNFIGSTANIFGGTNHLYAGGLQMFEGIINIMSASLSSLDTNFFPLFANAKAGKVYRTWINNQRISAASVMLDFKDVWVNFKMVLESVYFLNSGGDATFQNMDVVDSTMDYGQFAFAASGIKTFIDCNVNEEIGEYLASVLTIHKKTLTMNVVTIDEVAIPNVSIKVFDKNLLKVVDTTTDALGEAPIQEVTYKYLLTDYASIVDMNPFKMVVTKAGWKDKSYEFDLYEPKVLEFVLENAGLTEEEN